MRFDSVSDSEKQTGCPYHELNGALMYLSIVTRPDIANTVSRLAQFMNEPSKISTAYNECSC